MILVCFSASLLKYGGDVAVGAMTILISAMQLSMLSMQGQGQGTQPIISYNFGVRNRERVKKTFRLPLLPLIYLMPHLVSDPVTDVYLAEPAADTIAVSFTVILFRFRFRKALRSLEDE